MEGCTAPVARPFPCKRSCTTGATKQARSCSICGRAFPHPPRVGFAPPCLGTQAREPERRGKGTPSLPLTLAPDDLERRAPHHPFDPAPAYVQTGVPCHWAGHWVHTWHPPLLTRHPFAPCTRVPQRPLPAAHKPGCGGTAV